MRIDLRRGEARIALFFSEPDAQKIAGAVGSNPTSPALLKALLEALRAAGRSVGRSDGAVQIPAGGGADAPSASTSPAAPPATPDDSADGGSSQSEWEAEWEAAWEAEWERRVRRRRRRRRRNHRVSPGQRARLRRRIRASAATALSAWARTGGQEFVRAAQDAQCGVTVKIRVTGLRGESASGAARGGSAMVAVTPGRSRP
jgi:hypothetical protein